MLEAGIILLFLAPGLVAYAALYGIFHDGKAIAPEPPGPNSVEAVIIIAGVALAVHTLCATLFTLNGLFCQMAYGWCFSAPRPWTDPYRSAIAAVGGSGITGNGVTMSLLGISAQCLVVYVGVRRWLAMRARQDRLPAWIYGWSVTLANALDNSETAVLAYVLTNTECGGKTVGYGGLIHDIALKPDGCITRIALTDCERYLVDLSSGFDAPSLSDTLSRFSFMIIDAQNIQNVAFETITLDEIV